MYKSTMCRILCTNQLLRNWIDTRSFGGDGVGVDGLQLDSADTGTGLNAELDVASITPGGAPRVLHEEVIGAVFGAVTNSEDTVVEGGSTVSASEDTGLVMLEHDFVGFDGDGDGLLGEGVLEAFGGALGNLGESGDLDGSHLEGFVALATDALSRGVGVVGLGVEGVLFQPPEGKGHGATLASVVGELVALDELLLGEGGEWVAVDLVRSFDGTCGRE